MPACSASTLRAGTANPVSPSSTSSGTQPQFSLTTVGQPWASASLTTRPQGSLWLGRTMQAAR